MATKKATPKKAILDIELVPNAWPRFEKFIREIVKAGPQHRNAEIKRGQRHKRGADNSRLAGDPAIVSLRRALDRHYAAAAEPREDASNGLVGVILSCLPPDIFNCIFLPADGTRSPRLTITFKPAFRSYVTFSAEYWVCLIHGHMSSHRGNVTEHIE